MGSSSGRTAPTSIGTPHQSRKSSVTPTLLGLHLSSVPENFWGEVRRQRLHLPVCRLARVSQTRVSKSGDTDTQRVMISWLINRVRVSSTVWLQKWNTKWLGLGCFLWRGDDSEVSPVLFEVINAFNEHWVCCRCKIIQLIHDAIHYAHNCMWHDCIFFNTTCFQ